MGTSERLVLFRDSLSNTSLDCEPLGLHYQFATRVGLLGHAKTTEVRRWEERSKRYIPIASWERHKSHSDVFNLPSGKVIATSKFLDRKRTSSKAETSFVGDDGRKYIWKESSKLVAYVTDKDKLGTHR
ncbi:hypothetical protein SCHPADRAFT_898138 [Schizopora paradoxa]|uniref:DUF6593 domain-containing protein n=1 Tax=Schizopora paradoxa TaxID=27342 RepID=A0A0H2SEC7_9AGAM|nr:hypothetical protein SCHPADRAFT_898138 [Schizopora paradoxa]